MRRLRAPVGAIPRAFADHRRANAKRYREYCVAIQEQWGPLPKVALPVLKEAGRAFVELDRLNADLEAARGRRNGKRDANRVRRQLFMLREQHARLEKRIQELTAERPRTSVVDRLREVAR